MSTTPVFLKHSDQGAPSLDGSAGAMAAVWKWALPQLGWTIEYEDVPNNKVAFRNSPVDGLGYYVQLTDPESPLSTSAGWTKKVTAYESMTGIDTGTNQFGLDNWFFGFNAFESARTPLPWFIIGDNRTFYWWGPSRYTGGAYPMQVVGEFEPLLPGDIWHFMLDGYYSTRPPATSTSLCNGIHHSTSKIARSHDGLMLDVINDQSVYMNRFAYFGTNGESGAPAVNFSSGGQPQPLGGGYFLAEWFIGESKGIRGRARGLYVPNISHEVIEYNHGQVVELNTPNGLRNCAAMLTQDEPGDSTPTFSDIGSYLVDLVGWG